MSFVIFCVAVIVTLVLVLMLVGLFQQKQTIQELREQLSHARQNILEDRQWLGHNKIARAICTRHANLLHTAWRQMVHQDQSNFRKEIGLEPDFKNEGKALATGEK